MKGGGTLEVAYVEATVGDDLTVLGQGVDCCETESAGNYTINIVISSYLNVMSFIHVDKIFDLINTEAYRVCLCVVVRNVYSFGRCPDSYYN